jgi:UDP-2,3-diacylglucosamine hydrolase
MAVIAIREEASPELERVAKRLHWVSLGELSRTIELLHQEGVKHAVMAGQVKHNKIFSAIRPDWRLAKLLFSLPAKNTDSLIGAIARVLGDEDIELVDSTKFLGSLLPTAGVLTRRGPDKSEAADIAYGRKVAGQIAGLDLGQMVVVRDCACVAIEAMEGTDETIERAARITGGQKLVVVKVSKPTQDMRFDVPVIGLKTIEVMRRSNATALAIDAARTLLFDRDELIRAADNAGIAIEAFAPEKTSTQAPAEKSPAKRKK